MMNFIKTVKTLNGNYAVFFQQENTDYIAGVFLNKDGHLIRPMSGWEPNENWQSWGSDAKSVVPKFHIPFLTIGRELEEFMNFKFTVNYGNSFSTVSQAQKWVEETGFELVRTEKYESISFMGKTITAYAVWYLDPEDEWPNHCQSGMVITGSWYFNTIS